MTGDLFDSMPPVPGPPAGARHGARPARKAAVRGSAGWRLRAPEDVVYSVSAANALARDVIERSLPPLWVQGEVTGWKRHTSGHCYFCLRDRGAQLRAVMFRLDAQRLPADPDEGMEVRALGTLTLYEKRGEYQFVVREVEGKGAGGLWRLAFERLRAKLDAEGLLAPGRKRPLPRFPSAIGVVTSPVGAALHDILEVTRARAPWTRVVLAPARVQGAGAAFEVGRALERLGRSGLVDLIIVGRGGGGTEDLSAFNDERLARAIAASPVPVISAVGHEIDVTIADLVADVRAPTPSAAAERAVPDGHALGRDLAAIEARLRAACRRTAEARRADLGSLREELARAARDGIVRRRDRLHRFAGKLDALSPLGALARGYAVPLDANGRILRAVEDVRAAGVFDLRVVDGRVRCRTTGGGEAGDDGG